MSEITPKSVAAAMRKEAKKQTGKPPTFRIFRGWKFGLSYGSIPLPGREVVDQLKGSVARRMGTPSLADATYEQITTAQAAGDAAHVNDRQWIFSASLHPRGRSSVEEDWRFLGEMAASIEAPLDSLRTPTESTHPNAVHYWIWDDENGN